MRARHGLHARRNRAGLQRVVRLRRLSSTKGDDDQPVAVRLEDFEVSSNATGMIHSEQMLDVTGTFKLERLAAAADKRDRYRLTNGSSLALSGAGVVGRSGATWLGSLAAGATIEFALGSESPANAWSEGLDSAPTTRRERALVGINLRELIDLQSSGLGPGELRLVGWAETPLPGLTVRPTAAQVRAANLIVVHLHSAALPPPQADRNTRASVTRVP